MRFRRSSAYWVCLVTLGACEAESTGTPADCEVQASALEAEINTGVQGCTAVVRLAFDTYAPADWALFCGPYKDVDETQARATASAEIDYGADLAEQAPGSALNPPNPLDAYVFEIEPADLGGFAVVSARTGLAVLGGRLNWSQPANVLYPAEWRDVSQLGGGCTTSISIPTAHVYDFAIDSLAPTPEDIDRVYQSIGQTVLPSAFSRAGTLSDVVLIRLQRTVHGSNRPLSTSEWLVLVNGGTPR